MILSTDDIAKYIYLKITGDIMFKMILQYNL